MRLKLIPEGQVPEAGGGSPALRPRLADFSTPTGALTREGLGGGCGGGGRRSQHSRGTGSTAAAPPVFPAAAFRDGDLVGPRVRAWEAGQVSSPQTAELWAVGGGGGAFPLLAH